MAEFTPDPDDVTFEYMMMPVIPMLADEGALNVGQKNTRQSGAKGNVHDFDDEIFEGDHLIPSADWEVQFAPVNTQTFLGFAQENPTYGEGVQIHELEDPSGSPYATPPKRMVAVEVLGHFIRTIDLIDTTVVAGDSIKPDEFVRNKWEKDATPNDTLVLIGGTAPARVTALMGFHGRH